MRLLPTLCAALLAVSMSACGGPEDDKSNTKAKDQEGCWWDTTKEDRECQYDDAHAHTTGVQTLTVTWYCCDYGDAQGCSGKVLEEGPCRLW